MRSCSTCAPLQSALSIARSSRLFHAACPHAKGVWCRAVAVCASELCRPNSKLEAAVLQLPALLPDIHLVGGGAAAMERGKGHSMRAQLGMCTEYSAWNGMACSLGGPGLRLAPWARAVA